MAVFIDFLLYFRHTLTVHSLYIGCMWFVDVFMMRVKYEHCTTIDRSSPYWGAVFSVLLPYIRCMFVFAGEFGADFMITINIMGIDILGRKNDGQEGIEHNRR